jgi:hypothetical protein
MASRLSDIGFLVETRQEFAALAEQACQVGQHVSVAEGVYCHWAVGQGVELWGQLDPAGQVIGLHLHFGGPARMRVGLTERVTAGAATPLDGAFYGWADPSGDSPMIGAYNLVFDAPDYGTYGGLVLPHIVTVQIAAFAHQLAGYADEAAFEGRSSTSKHPLAAEAFIPSGLFLPDGGIPNPPQAQAILSGHVLAVEERVNRVGGQRFWWAHVRTYRGEVDVVADPAIVQGTLAVGGIVEGSFWLSGRIVEVPGY